ncbi:MAG: Uncharacterized protein XD63_0445 [Thermoanaerobacterales bacterium 50_218]|nr:MAG: Uncharacterized protein XD63_0445 [Thermoanaerobacterales bacterium 50_218]
MEQVLSHQKLPPRIVEAYVGEYASGKSENAINRALDLARLGRKVTLVDLDLVEPFYTLRPIKKELQELGIDVLAWETGQTFGLGETGNILKPEVRWVLRRQGDIILDVGYGVGGVRVLNLIEGAWEDPDLRIYAVINIARPFNSTVEEVVEYVKTLGRVDGLINNSHLGNQTDLEFIQEGARIVAAAAKVLGIPVIATAVADDLAGFKGERDCLGHPIRVLHRFMPHAFW